MLEGNTSLWWNAIAPIIWFGFWAFFSLISANLFVRVLVNATSYSRLGKLVVSCGAWVSMSVVLLWPMFAFLAWRDVYYPAFDVNADTNFWHFWPFLCGIAFALPACVYVDKNKRRLNALGYRFR